MTGFDPYTPRADRPLESRDTVVILAGKEATISVTEAFVHISYRPDGAPYVARQTWVRINHPNFPDYFEAVALSDIHKGATEEEKRAAHRDSVFGIMRSAGERVGASAAELDAVMVALDALGAQ